jgi:Ca2+-binding RTX toxin-like protein
VLDDLLIKCTFSVGTNLADILRGDRNDNIIFAANGNDTVYAGTGNDVVYGSGGLDLLYGGGGKDRLYGGAGNDVLYGEGGDDVLAGEDGVDRLIDTLGNNVFSGGGGNDYVEAGAGNDYIATDEGRDTILAGDGNNVVYSGSDDDYIRSGSGNDQIWTDGGRDIVQSGAGSDIVDAGDNNDLVDAGAGNDTISAGKGNDWIAAGKGDDTVDGGQGKNIFAFNRGDGRDTLINGGWDNDTISLGGIRYADLKLSKSGDDLVLDLGQNDSITLKNWYAQQPNRSVDLLQVVTLGADYDAASTDKTKNRQVEVFDFEKIVQRFEAVRAANSANSTGWAAMNSMLDTYLLGSDTQALGGDLSFQYAAMGSLTGIGLNSAQSSLSAGTDLQKLKTRQQLELGAMHLS